MMIHRPRRWGFTLIELLVVVVIIVILIGILIPTVNKVRIGGYAASAAAQVQAISAAIEQYHQTFGAYPGPLTDDEIWNGNATYVPPGFNTFGLPTAPPLNGYDTRFQKDHLTGCENLVLGLMGGLQIVVTGPPNALVRNLIYDPQLVGGGPNSLNAGLPKHYPAFIGGEAKLSTHTDAVNGITGHFSDIADAGDSIIPEFVDPFPSAMPVLYLRARVGGGGATVASGNATSANNAVITGGPAGTPGNPVGQRTSQYDLSQIIGYTGAFTGTFPNMVLNNASGASIGEGKKLDTYYNNSSTGTPISKLTVPPYHGLRTVNVQANITTPAANYYMPADAFPYFQNPGMADTPRKKDSYILISPGKDRVYGTEDDITSFGPVFPSQ